MRHQNRQGRSLIIVFIIYFDGIPHEVVTIDPPRKHRTTWYVEPCGGNQQDLMYYEAGNGGNPFEVSAHAVEGTNCQLWVEPIYRDMTQISLINCELIEEPLRLTDGIVTYISPFVVGREVLDITYCQKCELYFDEEYCPKHSCEFTEGAEEEWTSRNE